MEIPAWVETVFQKVVVVFEAPASDTLEAAGSTALLPWLDSLLEELPYLASSIRGHALPTRFLTNVLGFSPEGAARLPALLTLFLIFYILCGAATVFLRLRMNQRSLLKFSRQSFNAFLIWSCVLLLPMRKALIAGGDESLYPKLALVGIVFAVVMPLISMIRYIWVYRLFGIPHAVFDPLFGLFALSVFYLSARTGKILIFLVFLAMAALTVIQWEPDTDEADLPREHPTPKVPAQTAPQRPVPAQRSASAQQRPASARPASAQRPISAQRPASPQRTAAPQRATPAPKATAAAATRKPDFPPDEVEFDIDLETLLADEYTTGDSTTRK